MFNINILRKEIFTVEQMEDYINIADSVSYGKAQVNWQEVMTIAMVLYDGNSNLIQDDDLKMIAERFLEKSDSSYKIKEFQTVLEELGFQEEQIVEANEYLEKINTMDMQIETLVKDLPTSYSSDVNDINKDDMLDVTISNGILNVKVVNIKWKS